MGEGFPADGAVAAGRTQKVTAVGFEPTRIAPPELESGALDRSAKLSLETRRLTGTDTHTIGNRKVRK